MIGDSAPLRVIQDSASLIGYGNRPQSLDEVAMILSSHVL